ncbi:MAG: hypothetical protein U0234_22795 [Sandaracinus sp.]
MRRALALLTLGLVSLAAPAAAQDAESASDERVDASYATDTPGVVLSWCCEEGLWVAAAPASGALRLPERAIDLGLSLHDHGPVRVAQATRIPRGALLSAHYESRQWMRELGVGIVLGGILAALVGVAIGIGAFVDHTPDTGVAGLAAGLGVGVVGITTGLVLATREDAASLDVE